MKNIMLIAMSLVLAFVVGCAGSKSQGSGRASLFSEQVEKVIDSEPDWWTTPEVRDGWLIGKGSGTSRSKDGSRMKAKNNLINDLSQKTKVITEGRTSMFTSETGTDIDSEIMEKFDNVQNTIWGGAVNGWVEIKSATVAEATQDQNGRKKTIFRTYIVGGIDHAAQDKKMLDQINRDKQLRTAFEASKAQGKLQQDLNKYKDSFKY